MRVDSVHREKGMDRHDESSVFVSDVYHDESRLSRKAWIATMRVVLSQYCDSDIQHNEVLCYITMYLVYHDESRLSPSRERHGSPR